MTINMALRAEIGQALHISRQAIQAIEILQFSQEELNAFIARETERNPLIALAGGQARAPAAAPAFAPPRAGMAARPAADMDIRGIEETHASQPSLAEHLRGQLSLMRLDDRARFLALQIVGSLDGDGYFRRGLGEMAALTGADPQALAGALAIVQSLEPAGVGARDLAECLRLQLQDAGALTPAMEALLASLDALVSGDPKRLARRCGVPVETLGAMVRRLRRLTPSPGARFDCTPPQPAVADVLLTHDGEGRLRVELNGEVLPRVLVDRAYWAELSACGLDGPGRRYLSDCLQNATSLVRSLDQRAKTVLKIAMAIARRQRAYFLHGPGHLRPLSQKAIASAVGVHESTVCRAIANKHILCAHGLVPMKFLFPDGLPAEEGRPALASEIIRRRIRALVEAEKDRGVLSDDAIVARLGEEGIEIARRTVAKYRTQLRIPSSAQRRRQLLMCA